MATFKKFLDLLTAREKKRAACVFVLMLITALFDVLGVASIMPFMAILADPQLIESNLAMTYVFNFLGYQNRQDFLLASGLCVFLLLITSLCFKALSVYSQTRFALMREYSISKQLVECYLQQPYAWFLNRHSADLGKTILSEVGNLVHGGLLPLLTLIAQCIVAVCLMGLLLLVDPWLAISVGVVLGGAYLVVFKFMSGLLQRLGAGRVSANQQRYAAVSEAFGAVKEIKLKGIENVYAQRFTKPARLYAKAQTTAHVIGQLPRFMLEGIAFGGMLVVILYLMSQSGDFAKALPVIALYAFAGYRLLPALQQIYLTLTQLRFAGPALDILHKDLISLGRDKFLTAANGPFEIKVGITLSRIEYCYPNSLGSVLKGISMHIPVNTTVGLVGATGGGKTTTIDIILGLLEPLKGRLIVDGVVITEVNRTLWQKNIGYVPQQIYLSDDTVAANIAFGLEAKDIDMQAVERAARIANLHEFIINDLDAGYQSTVGERGVRLSGGQRQRIGIARALYHSPRVLILDEATSALDNLTEQAVMDAVHNLSHEITIILIAHRLSTVRECDQIFLLEKGEIAAQGTFDELVSSSDHFRAMAGAQ